MTAVDIVPPKRPRTAADASATLALQQEQLQDLQRQVAALQAQLVTGTGRGAQDSHDWAARARQDRADALAERIATNRLGEVRLGVDGRVFRLPLSSIERQPYSVLGSLFSGRWPLAADADGVYRFADLPCTSDEMAHVVDFHLGRLRDSYGPEESRALQATAHTFGLDAMAQAVAARTVDPHTTLLAGIAALLEKALPAPAAAPPPAPVRFEVQRFDLTYLPRRLDDGWEPFQMAGPNTVVARRPIAPWAPVAAPQDPMA